MKNVHSLSIALLLIVGMLAACSTDGGGGARNALPTVGFPNLAADAVVPPDFEVRITASAADELRQVSVQIDDGERTTVEPRGEFPFPLPGLADGPHTISAVVTDAQGRQAEATRSFRVDADATADPGAGPGTGPVTGDPSTGEPDDGGPSAGDPSTDGSLAVEWVAPASTRPVAGDVALEVRAPNATEITLWYQAEEGDPQHIAEGSGSTLATTWSTLMLQPGPYTLIARADGPDGTWGTSEIVVEVASALVITNPEPDDGIGPGEDRRQVDVTVGLSGTVRDGAAIVSVELLIGSQADGRDALVTRDSEGAAAFVYSWDTCEPSAGHDPAIIGDRTLHVLVNFTTGEELISDGVEVAFAGGCL